MKWGSKQRRPISDMRADYAGIMGKIRANVELTETGCWRWLKSLNSLGYAQASWAGMRWAASRLVYAAVHGPFDKDMDICHTCDFPACVNPQHLFVAHHSDNMMDSIEKGRHAESERTHCPRGHEYTPENTELKKTGKRGKGTARGCRTCHRARLRIRNGWPEDLAYATPILPHAYASPLREQSEQE